MTRLRDERAGADAERAAPPTAAPLSGAAAGAMQLLICSLLAAALLAQPAAASAPVPCAAQGALACMNNGTCFEDVREGSYCRCAAGYAGSLCELSITAAPTPCSAPQGVPALLVNSCLNGGSCPTDAVSFCDCTTVATDAAGNTFRCAPARDQPPCKPRPPCARRMR